MITYSAVPEVPTNLKKTDFVLYKPNFLEEVKASRQSNQVANRVTTANHLREILMIITGKYDDTINPYHVSLNKYEGIATPSLEDLANVIVKIDKDNNLGLFEKALAYKIKNRPSNTENIFYITDDMRGTDQFYKNGIEMAKSNKAKSETVV